jgi:hypothetical protein
VFILKEVKVLCFDTLLQVLILKGLRCTEIVQNLSIFVRGGADRKQPRGQKNGADPNKKKRPIGRHNPPTRFPE